MALFTVRRELAVDEAADPRDLVARTSLAAPVGDGPGWRASVWIPETRALTCIFESGAPPPLPGGHSTRVIEVSPDEFLPIVHDLEPGLHADPEAQQRGRLVVIKRSVQGWTEDDLRSGALRAMMCSFEYPELTWVRTYWSQESETTFCLFKTKDHEQAREHSKRSRIPFDAVWDAVEFTPSDLRKNPGPGAGQW